jgi:cytochrome c
MKAVLKTLAISSLALTISGAALASDWEGGDAAKGQKIFNKCKACHTIDPAGANAIGPDLYGVFGRKAGSKADYTYSAAMKAKGDGGLVWSEETLFQYLEKPQAYVPGTNMSFPGLKKPEDRKDLIAYLEKATGHEK